MLHAPDPLWSVDLGSKGHKQNDIDERLPWNFKANV